MEDSYTVHRRRKAAARRREKTPDPSSRNQQLVETSDDEEEARRARMIQMAEDAERMELDGDAKVRDELEPRIEEKKKRSPSKVVERDTLPKMGENSPSKESQTRESDGVDEASARSIKKEVISKVDNESPVKEESTVVEVIAMQEGYKDDASKEETGIIEKEKYKDAIPKSKEIDGDVDRPVEPRKMERRLKKKSRERLERHGQSSDSSDMEEVERHPRRTKSPEVGKIKTKRTASKKISSGDLDVATRHVIEKPPREKKSSRQKLEEDSVVKPERRRSRLYSQTDDTDEDRKMKKSESFPRQGGEVIVKRSSSDAKKQIIPLSNDSLIQDFAKAQEEYLRRERGILDPDTPDVFEDAQETILRRRKFSTPLTESEEIAIEKSIEKLKESEEKRKKSWFPWLPFFAKKIEEKEPETERDEGGSKKISVIEETSKKRQTKLIIDQPTRVTLMDFLRALRDVVAEFKAFVEQNPKETRIVRRLRNRCLSELMLVMIYCGLGAFVFRFTEGAFEAFYKCGVKRVKRDFLDTLWNYSHNLREDDWKSMARRKLMEFEEQLHTAHEAGVHTYSGQRSWSFLNAVVYCLTVITTIGEENTGYRRDMWEGLIYDQVRRYTIES